MKKSLNNGVADKKEGNMCESLKEKSCRLCINTNSKVVVICIVLLNYSAFVCGSIFVVDIDSIFSTLPLSHSLAPLPRGPMGRVVEWRAANLPPHTLRSHPRNAGASRPRPRGSLSSSLCNNSISHSFSQTILA